MNPPFSTARPRSTSRRLATAAAWSLPLLAWGVIAGLSTVQSDPGARAEGAFLAVYVAGFLAVIAALGSRPGAVPTPALGWTALLATATVWIAYHGPPRGAAVSVVLVAGVTAAAAAAWRIRTATDPGRGPLSPGFTVPLALAVQLAARSELLFTPLQPLRELVALLALPAVAGVALSVLATRLDARRVLLAGGAAAMMAPGWNVASTLGLAALAAGAAATDPRRPWPLRTAAGATLLLLPAWNPGLGVLYALAGLSLYRGRRTYPWLLVGAVVAVAGAAVLIGAEPPPLPAVAGMVAGGLILVPGLVAAPREDLGRLAGGVAVALAAAALGGGPAEIAIGVALVALTTPAAGAVAELGRTWAAVAGVGTALLAAYPWVRDDPRGDFLALLGAERSLPALGVVLAAAALAGLLLRRARPLAPAALVLSAATLAAAWTLGPTAVLVESYNAVAVDAEHRHWQQKFPPQKVSAVVLDTNLVRGGELAAGTPVAVVRLRDADLRVLRSWDLRVGRDTAEWAAGRADVAARPGFTAPPPWVSWVAPDGTFFGQRFRARLTLDPPLDASAISISLAPRLTPKTPDPSTAAEQTAVQLVVYHLELRE